MRTWLLNPSLGFLKHFKLVPPSTGGTTLAYRQTLARLFGHQGDGFTFLHHNPAGRHQFRPYCDFKSMWIAAQWFWTRKGSIAARTVEMYQRYKTLKTYMAKVDLWETRAPSIGLAALFSAVSPTHRCHLITNPNKTHRKKLLWCLDSKQITNASINGTKLRPRFWIVSYITLQPKTRNGRNSR